MHGKSPNADEGYAENEAGYMTIGSSPNMEFRISRVYKVHDNKGSAEDPCTADYGPPEAAGCCRVLNLVIGVVANSALFLLAHVCRRNSTSILIPRQALNGRG